MSQDRSSVRIVDVFDAPRDVVFAAWTEPERLKQWWGPGFFETVFAEVDLRPGGRYELLLEPGSMRLMGEFREVRPPRRLVYTWRWASVASFDSRNARSFDRPLRQPSSYISTGPGPTKLSCTSTTSVPAPASRNSTVTSDSRVSGTPAIQRHV